MRLIHNEYDVSGDGQQLLCSVCGNNYVRLEERPEENPRILRFVGECGHEFDVEFEFHKGYTFVRTYHLARIPIDQIGGKY